MKIIGKLISAKPVKIMPTISSLLVFIGVGVKSFMFFSPFLFTLVLPYQFQQLVERLSEM